MLEEGTSRIPSDCTIERVSKWYMTVLVDLLHEEKEPIEWRGLHVGAERGVNCEHMQTADEHPTMALGVAGGSLDQCGTRVPQMAFFF